MGVKGTSWNDPQPRQRHSRRIIRSEALEVAIALGETNTAIMRRFRITYAELQQIKAEMNGEPIRQVPSRRRISPCGSEQAWRRHRAHKQRPCDECQDAHEARLRLQADARSKAPADSRFRGVA